MSRVVEITGNTYEEAVQMALAELGAPRDCVEVILLHTRDTDRRHPGPERYTVRVWECGLKTGEYETPEDVEINLPAAHPVVCERTAPTMEEAARLCLEELGIEETDADIQVLQREDTNPFKAGPERVTVRVWRRHITEPAPKPGAPGAEHIHEVHAAAHLPDDDDLHFRSPEDAEETP